MAREGQSLWVTLKARTSQFERGIKRAKRVVHDFRKAIPGLNLVLNRFTAALSVGAVGFFVKQQLTAIDATAKFAQRLGMATEGLVGLQHAASITGVKVEALQMGLQRMTRRVAEAAMGTGEARGALQELGIDARELTQLRPEDQFARIADKMTKVATQGDRVRLAMKLFDSEGVALVNTLALGSDGLERMKQEARDLGLTFSGYMASKVEAANDALTRLRGAFTGLVRQLAVGLTPFIKGAADDLVEWRLTWKDSAKDILSAIESVSLGVAKIGDVFTSIGAIFKGVFGAMMTGMGAFGQMVADVVQGIESMLAGLSDSWLGKQLGIGKVTLGGAAMKRIATGITAQGAGWMSDSGRMFRDVMTEASSREIMSTFDRWRRSLDEAAGNPTNQLPGVAGPQPMLSPLEMVGPGRFERARSFELIVGQGKQQIEILRGIRDRVGQPAVAR